MANKKANDLYLAIYNPYKGVDPWSKQISVPHAKQGLQTDIVMGDEAVYQEYSPTMKDHYPRHTELAQEAVEREIPAGRPLGPPSAKTKVNVVFGDKMKHQPERLRSLATDDYVAKVRNNPPKDKEKEERAKELNQWLPNKELMMTAAHVGTATRENIPLDTKHFAHFTSTNMDVYIPPKDVKPIIRFDLKPHGATHIPTGDREKQNSYATESTTSFIPHNIKSIGNERDRGFHTQRTNKALLGKSGEHTQFETTSQSIFQAPSSGFSDRSISLIKGQQRGRSNIAFGQHFEEPKTNFIALEKTKESVTQRDFNSDHEIIGREHPAPHHIKWSKNVIMEAGNEDGIKIGMTSAVRPDNRKNLYDSCASDAFSCVNDSKYKSPVGPITETTVNSKMMYSSSIPTGDETKFPSQELSTITSCSYPAYVVKMPTFPILGARITETGFSLGDGVGSNKVGVSTSAASFVNHGRRFKNVEKSKNGCGLDMLKAANEEYGMSDNSTTNNAVFKAPKDRDIAHAFEPKIAERKLLFPLRAQPNTHKGYETTMQSFYHMRQGLLDVTQPLGITGHSQSAIAFGDRKHFGI
ncbi:hypothetical protein HDU98_005164 [Podochytrium sp. JEL0797]|nr:hypothetical protein HDU98_005164 [Podochytrium sp. JEL0797]